MNRPFVVAYLGLGSNLGDREAALREAVRRLDRPPSLTVAACSDVYETSPVGPVLQGPFLNMVVAVRTCLSPEELLDAALGIETAMGRVRTVRWGPRTIDIDLLLYDRSVRSSPRLTVPHPRMAERAFVLVPLVDVMKRIGAAEADLWEKRLKTVQGKESVRKWETSWDGASGLFAN